MSDDLDLQYDPNEYILDDDPATIDSNRLASESVESGDYDEPEEEVEAEETDDDPWAWAKDKDPEAVRKTFEKFTPEWENVRTEKQRLEQERAELEGIRKLRDEIMQDPGLVRAIEGYMTSPDRTPDRTIAELQNTVNGLQAQMKVDAEFADVQAWARAEGLPLPDKGDLIRNAIETGAGNLLSAYKVMNFDTARKQAVNKTVEGIKKSKGAKAVPSTTKDKPARKLTRADYAKMSDDELTAHWGEILGGYSE